MSSPQSEQIEQLREQYRRQFAELRDTQQRLAELSCTVTAPRQVVVVTVGHGGAVKDVRFPGAAHKRMAPAELASVVLKTIVDAQRQVAGQAAEVIAPTLPPGVDARKLMSGDVDLQSLLSPEPGVHDATRDAMNIRG